MRIPDPEDIESEFTVLDEEYDQPGFYGGAFEGSHSYADVVILRLYSIVPVDGEEFDRLRIETRHHAAGRVLDHDRTEYELKPDRTVTESDQSIEAFCRTHHFEDSHEEVVTLVEDLIERRE